MGKRIACRKAQHRACLRATPVWCQRSADKPRHLMTCTCIKLFKICSHSLAAIDMGCLGAAAGDSVKPVLLQRRPLPRIAVSPKDPPLYAGRTQLLRKLAIMRRRRRKKKMRRRKRRRRKNHWQHFSQRSLQLIERGHTHRTLERNQRAKNKRAA